jgi:hypothetical protein
VGVVVSCARTGAAKIKAAAKGAILESLMELLVSF